MIEYFFYMVVVFCLIVTTDRVINVYRAKKFLKTEISKIEAIQNKVSKNLKTVIILIPVYFESEILKTTLKRFENIVKNKKNVKIYFITTEKEGSPNKNKSYTTIRNHVRTSRVFIIHYPNVFGSKANQLNYAIQKLNKQIINRKETFFVIFDADSNPDIAGIDYVLNDPMNEKAYQMFSVYSGGFNKNPHIHKANALFQTRWSLSYELPLAIKNYNAQKIKNLTYFIGHGLFIRSDCVTNNFFPEYTLTEDIALGYRFCFKNTIIKPVPYFDYCSVPNNMLVNIKQSARWFAGELLLFKEFLKNKGKKNEQKLKNFLLVSKRYFYLSHWLLVPPIFFIMIVFSLIKKDFVLGLFLFTILIEYIYVLHNSCEFVFEQKKIKIKLGTFFFLLVKTILNFLGPLYSIYRIILDKLGLKKYEFFKTSR